MSEGTQARRQATPVEMAALGSAVRLRIIRLTHGRSLTNKQIAERLDRDPATTLHHVRKLVSAGFLEAMPQRRGNRGAKEIPYRSTGRSWALDIDHGDDTKAAEVAEAMLQAYLGEVARVGMADLVQSRLIVQVDEADRAELMGRVAALFDEYSQRPLDPSARRTGIYLAFYPGE